MTKKGDWFRGHFIPRAALDAIVDDVFRPRSFSDPEIMNRKANVKKKKLDPKWFNDLAVAMTIRDRGKKRVLNVAQSSEALSNLCAALALKERRRRGALVKMMMRMQRIGEARLREEEARAEGRRSARGR